MDFKGKVVLVTGGTRGIGRAITLAFARQGARVAAIFINDQSNADSLTQELASITKDFMVMQADVRDLDQVQMMMKKLEGRFGKIHYLINNAGVNRDRSFKKMEAAEWKEVIDTNLTGVFNCCRSAMNHMFLEKDSRIVVISSVVGQMGRFGQVNYASAKAGLEGFVKSLAIELARHQMTVNGIAPGLTDTEMFYSIPKEIREQAVRDIPLNRIASPEEIAHAVMFLCAPQSGYITGEIININGGMHM